MAGPIHRAGKRIGAVYELAQVVRRVRHVERWRGFSGDLVVLAQRLRRVEDLDQHGDDLADRLAKRFKNVRCVDVALGRIRRQRNDQVIRPRDFATEILPSGVTVGS